MFLLLSAALASQCLVGPASLSVERADWAGPGAFSARVSGGWKVSVSDVAAHLRLRAPSGALVPLSVSHLWGEVLFAPVAALEPGAYVVEVLADYDEDGRRLLFQRGVPVDRSAWFPLQRWEPARSPVAAAPTAPTAPTAVTWTRMHAKEVSSAGPVTILQVKASASPGTRVEVEVDGVGPIGAGSVPETGKVWMRLGHSMCMPHSIDLPTQGDLRVRLVAVGGDGARAPGPWTTLGPSSPVSVTGPEPIARPPEGVAAPLGGVHSWQPLDHTPPPGETERVGGSCGQLAFDGERDEVTLKAGESFRVDSEQALRKVSAVAGVITVDGRAIDWVLPSREPAAVHLAGARDELLLGVHDRNKQWLYLLRLRGAEVLQTAEIFGVHGVRAFDLDGDELRVAWFESSDIRFSQRFDRELVPIGPPTEAVDPIRITEIHTDGFRGLGVNGHPIAMLEGHHLREGWAVHDRLAFIPAYGRDSQLLVAARPDGTVVWWLRIQGNQYLRRTVVDERGVHVVLRDYTDESEVSRSFTHQGQEITPPLQVPPRPRQPKRDPPAETLLTHGARTLAMTRHGRDARLSVVEEGARSGALAVPDLTLVAVRPDGAELVGTIPVRHPEPPRVWIQSVVCTGEALGVPEVWRPGE